MFVHKGHLHVRAVLLGHLQLDSMEHHGTLCKFL